jgi:hypothetical protein
VQARLWIIAALLRNGVKMPHLLTVFRLSNLAPPGQRCQLIGFDECIERNTLVATKEAAAITISKVNHRR